VFLEEAEERLRRDDPVELEGVKIGSDSAVEIASSGEG